MLSSSFDDNPSLVDAHPLWLGDDVDDGVGDVLGLKRIELRAIRDATEAHSYGLLGLHRVVSL